MSKFDAFKKVTQDATETRRDSINTTTEEIKQKLELERALQKNSTG